MNLLDTFREGQSTADVRKTKLRAIYACISAPSILSGYAVLKAFWPDLPLSMEDFGQVVAWLVSGIAVVSHIISSKAVGVRKADFPDMPKPTDYERREADNRTYG